jgi:hypothetical protein
VEIRSRCGDCAADRFCGGAQPPVVRGRAGEVAAELLRGRESDGVRVTSSTGSSVPAAARMRSLIRIKSSRASTPWPRRTAGSPSGSSARRTSARERWIPSGRQRRYLRKAADSGSATTSLTIADESRWTARSRFTARRPAAAQGPGRLLPGREWQRRRELAKIAGRAHTPAARSRSIGPASGIGVGGATGRPRSVTSILSPAATRRSSSLARCRSSRTPTPTMSYS